VTALLRERGIPFAVIGAAALAAHGVSRATRDLDLLTLAGECLSEAFWERLRADGVRIDLRRGDGSDPLAGVVRLTVGDEHPLEVIVGRGVWQAEIFGRAIQTPVEGVSVPVASRADLILLKLYAGGPQDAWDVVQLLEASDREIVAQVEAGLGALPPEARSLWERVQG
jgi:hypothetical protein